MGDATHQGEDTETHMRMNWQFVELLPSLRTQS